MKKTRKTSHPQTPYALALYLGVVAAVFVALGVVSIVVGATPDTAPEGCERIPFRVPGLHLLTSDQVDRIATECPKGWRPVAHPD